MDFFLHYVWIIEIKYYLCTELKKDKIMSNWQTNIEKKEFILELKAIESTFERGFLDWNKINRKKSDELSVILDIIKRQCRNGLSQLKEGHKKTDLIYEKSLV